MFRRDVRRLLIIVILVAAAITNLTIFNVVLMGKNCADDGPIGFCLGLDLKGGIQLVYEASEDNISGTQMEGVKNIIERRVNAFGVIEPSIQIMGEKRLLIQLPGVDNVDEAKQLIGQTAKLEFKERTCQNDICSEYEDRDIGLTGEQLTRAYAGRKQTTDAPIVNIQFDSRGTAIFAEVTGKIAGTRNRLAVFLDEQELVAPGAESAILGGNAFIEGPDYTIKQVETIAMQLESGRLPVPIHVIQEMDVDATLGSVALSKSLQASYIGLGLVMLLMILYYRVPGVMASIALVSYVAMVLAVFKLFGVVLTLAGMAGFILSVGMAVDANILIFERTKEELRTGRSLMGAIDTGFNRAWPSIRDSNISTFIICAILFWLGSRLGTTMVVGFSLTLFIGVAISMFSAIFVTRTFLRMIALTPLRKATNLFTPVAGHLTTRNTRTSTRGG